jgi:hypothetical protein
MISLNINYKFNQSELCEIGAKFDTDKSSLRQGITNDRHCHPYTLFYNSLFKEHRHKNLNVAEIGILEGSSLLMWREYFKNSKIYGFEYDITLINKFLNNHDNENIILSTIDVTNKISIEDAFNNLNLDVCLNNLCFEKALSKIRPSLTAKVRDNFEDISLNFNNNQFE